MNSNLSLIPALLVLLVIACNYTETETKRTSNAPSSSSTPFRPPATAIFSPTPGPVLARTPLPLKSADTKSATVITENAGLRESPNGKVLQTLPLASSVEVIEQKKAWFYVQYGASKGWLHGNTIRYESRDVSSLPVSTPKTSTSRDYETRRVEKSNPSGATARCRDGTLSYSRNRRGTCSWHGGVAEWY